MSSIPQIGLGTCSLTAGSQWRRHDNYKTPRSVLAQPLGGLSLLIFNTRRTGEPNLFEVLIEEVNGPNKISVCYLSRALDICKRQLRQTQLDVHVDIQIGAECLDSPQGLEGYFSTVQFVLPGTSQKNNTTGWSG